MERASTLREATRPVTGDELIRMPGLDPCELVAGRVVPMTPTNAAHRRIEANVTAALQQFVRTQNLGVVMAGEVGVFTARNPDTVRAPDVLFLSHERDARRKRLRYIDPKPLRAARTRWTDVAPAAPDDALMTHLQGAHPELAAAAAAFRQRAANELVAGCGLASRLREQDVA